MTASQSHSRVGECIKAQRTVMQHVLRIKERAPMAGCQKERKKKLRAQERTHFSCIRTNNKTHKKFRSWCLHLSSSHRDIRPCPDHWILPDLIHNLSNDTQTLPDLRPNPKINYRSNNKKSGCKGGLQRTQTLPNTLLPPSRTPMP